MTVPFLKFLTYRILHHLRSIFVTTILTSITTILTSITLGSIPSSSISVPAPVDNVQQQPQQQRLELRVYSCRKNQQNVDIPLSLKTCHKFDSNSGNSSLSLPLVNIDDLSIAFRKGVRFCTQHPIAQVMGYDHLFSSMKALVSNLDDVETPKTIEEALHEKE
ncbi:hypothetical protein PanWU01x14_020760 [Parasponia andersonii]|uniref:Uncharacterized protein n=1 Tax=Parasponia andersonii TaxID=3476 RepID=A0A2P5DYR5_PARAD|nr:hypothetical protein PanWU01x14_020760 [Parasponia andersonii]